jgi:hypothetical protein
MRRWRREEPAARRRHPRDDESESYFPGVVGPRPEFAPRNLPAALHRPPRQQWATWVTARDRCSIRGLGGRKTVARISASSKPMQFTTLLKTFVRSEFFSSRGADAKAAYVPFLGHSFTRRRACVAPREPDALPNGGVERTNIGWCPSASNDDARPFVRFVSPTVQTTSKCHGSRPRSKIRGPLADARTPNAESRIRSDFGHRKLRETRSLCRLIEAWSSRERLELASGHAFFRIEWGRRLTLRPDRLRRLPKANADFSPR